MLLENITNNNLGKCFLYMQSDVSKHFVAMNFHDYSNWAYKYFLQDLVDFENLKSISLLGKNSVFSSCFWFLSIEAYVNSILKVLCIDNNIDFSLYKTKTLNSRIREINVLINFPHEEYCKGGLQSKLDEFENFRNEIFHDRSFENELKLSKTFLSKNPCLPNIISELQAMCIAMEFFSFYRYVFDNIDLMPNILVKKGNTFFFEKLDNIYRIIFIPSLKKILEKHHLETEFVFDTEFNSLSNIYRLNNYLISPLIKAVPNENEKINLSSEETNFLNETFSLYLKSKTLAEGKFGLPNYINNKN